ncbi:hypothetical protein, partial [Cellulosimicrobium sp. TH-20]|uniref:hypothetical protein n=1 Tax=Cellulosimicrobium sp. TH-20 TaxID=1980001 RepID=UPI001C994948
MVVGGEDVDEREDVEEVGEEGVGEVGDGVGRGGVGDGEEEVVGVGVEDGEGDVVVVVGAVDGVVGE